MPVVALWRTDGTLQVGLEPPGGLLIDDPRPAMERVLVALRTPRTRADLLRIGGHGADEWLDRLVDALGGCGLLRPHCPRTGPITVIGRGEQGLLVPTGDNVREPQNRRVEIVIQ